MWIQYKYVCTSQNSLISISITEEINGKVRCTYISIGSVSAAKTKTQKEKTC